MDLAENAVSNSTNASLLGTSAGETVQDFSLVINADVLKRVLKQVSGSIAKQAVQESLHGVYIHASAEAVTLRAGNGLHYIQTVVADQTSFSLTGQGGGLVVPGKRFVDLIQLVAGSTLTLEFQDLVLTVKAQGSRMTLKGFDLAQYPSLPSVNPQFTFTIPSEYLQQMYRKTLFSASKSESRPALTGVYHRVGNNRLKCAATDAHRLSQCEQVLANEVPDCARIIPASTLHEIARHLRDEEQVTVQFDTSYAIYSINDTTFYVRMLEGEYPNTDTLLPTRFSSEISFKAGVLRNLLERALLYCEGPGAIGHFIIRSKAKQVRVLSDQTEFGQFQEDIVPLTGSGANVVMSSNIRYLLDVLGAIPADAQVQFRLSGSGTPFVIQVPDSPLCEVYLLTQIRNHLHGDMAEIDDFHPSDPESDSDVD